MRMGWGVAAALLWGCAAHTPAVRDEPDVLTADSMVTAQTLERGQPLIPLHELVQRIELSPVDYQVRPLEELQEASAQQLVQLVWPSTSEVLPIPRMERDGKGRRQLGAYPGHSGADALLAQAEVHHQAQRYAQAEALYAQALQVAPDYYPAMLAYGDAALLGGDAAAALERYEKATLLNPDDHRSYLYRASALGRLGRSEEAHQMYAWALTLRPAAPLLLETIASGAAPLGLELRPPILTPRAFARREGEAVAVYADGATHAAWLAHGMCKAVWIGETELRQKRTGSKAHGFSTLEEMECLVALATAYSKPELREMEQDKELERLLQVLESGQHLELILYELGARRLPHLMLTLDEPLRRRVHAYVMRHVLVQKVPPACTSGLCT
jgi:tetratricopeptide (TPR) repeat protein